MARPSPYSAEFRARAVRLVEEAGPEHATEWAAMGFFVNDIVPEKAAQLLREI